MLLLTETVLSLLTSFHCVEHNGEHPHLKGHYTPQALLRDWVIHFLHKIPGIQLVP